MIRRPPRSTPLYSSAASDVYKRQVGQLAGPRELPRHLQEAEAHQVLSLIHISEPTRLRRISYAVFCLKKKKMKKEQRSKIQLAAKSHNKYKRRQEGYTK